MSYARYAVYVVPDGALGDAGAAWLGWDIRRGAACDSPQPQATARPRRYGFHATIKPPMRLADPHGADALRAAFRAQLAALVPVTLDGLALAPMGRFLALRPVGDTGALDALAARVVRGLDPFRAPMPPEERERRDTPRLSGRMRDNLASWGYPHVMQDFRFHITLTGPLRDPAPLHAAARTHFAGVLPAPYTVDRLTLAGEDATGAFHALDTVSLTGA